MSASSQMIVQWNALHARKPNSAGAALHARKHSRAIPKHLLHELAPPTFSEIAWLLMLFFWSFFCCPVTRLAFEVIGWVLEDLVPEATDIALCTDL
ncbi:uncharacterized protein PG998_009932 [Apiospora kogelbergensis]|uniref:Uncharacterized protein n=1 Tax=Apiospora kogelbergensis TaxID=1337665 RepID=A0AAW0R913_9PEZI